MMAHHTAVHQSTGVTPFSMMFGTQMRLPIDLLIGAPLVDNLRKLILSIFRNPLNVRFVEISPLQPEADVTVIF